MPVSTRVAAFLIFSTAKVRALPPHRGDRCFRSPGTKTFAPPSFSALSTPPSPHARFRRHCDFPRRRDSSSRREGRRRQISWCASSVPSCHTYAICLLSPCQPTMHLQCNLPYSYRTEPEPQNRDVPRTRPELG